MMKFIFTMVALFSINAWSQNFAQSAGDYKVTGCAGVAISSGINYCDYDELKISVSKTDSSLIDFEFLAKGSSKLKFNMKMSSSSTEVLSVDAKSQKVTLTSTDDGTQSETSIEPNGDGKLLTLSSISGDGIFTFILNLKSK